MSKLEFHYGTMGSSKSANLLMVAKNYELQGKRVLLLKPTQDTRNPLIKSRAIEDGMHAIPIKPDANIREIVETMKDGCPETIHCVLIDEAQFLTKKQVKELSLVADELNIPVMAYGLMKTYIDNTLFEGSQALVFYADKLKEIKTVCYFCNKKAVMNLRMIKNEPVYTGDVVVIGDIKEGYERYIPTCRHHYHNPVKN